MTATLWGLAAIIAAAFTGVCLDQHDWGWAVAGLLASAGCSVISAREIGK